MIIPSLFVTFAAVVARSASSSSRGCSPRRCLTLAALARPGGMRRAGGAALIVLYFAFVGGTLVGA